jgi:hypothetical protein
VTWRPAEVSGRYDRSRPKVGDVVAYDYRAWEVTHVRDAVATPEEEEQLAGYVQQFRDQAQPYRVSLRRVHGAPHERENDQHLIALRVPPRAYGEFPTYAHGRVPLCSCHGHPWPCREHVEHLAAEAALKRAEREMAILPGCCPECGEPVTSRQKSITFGGPNVRNPLAEGPTFHLRRKCRHGARQYEELWVNDEPGRARSLLTLKCAGNLIVHGDGTAECFGADGSDCPTVYAQHRSMSACYLQSHGCPRDCSRAGHPGTRVSGYPDDPRAITQEVTS